MAPKKGTPEYEKWKKTDKYKDFCKWPRNTAPMIAANIGRKRPDVSDKNKTEEMREKVSASKIGNKNPMFGVPPWNKGKKFPEMSERQRGCNNPNFEAKCVDDKYRERMSISQTGKRRGKDNPMWKGGISFLPYCFKFDNKRRKSVRAFFNNCCIICGKHEEENISGHKQVALSVHHIDHDKNQGCNGNPFNLVPLCHVCHNRELSREEEYKKHINKTLGEGFKWGIWSEKQYEKEVMY